MSVSPKLAESSEFRPFVPDSQTIPELTLSAVLLGSLLGIVFGASSLYLFLKVGMTVSASIPVAVISITVFRAFSGIFGTRRRTILENNIVQTAGSAGESIAFGVGATMPALMLLGYDMDPVRVMMVSVLGGILGILMMIPLRRAFIVNQHGELKYPEGTACAKILVAGEQGGASAKTVFAGFGIAFFYELLMKATKFWTDVPSAVIEKDQYKKAMIAMEASPALLGVGYIIGRKTASVMVAGGILTSLVIVPMIAYFGEGLTQPLDPAVKLIRNMDATEIRGGYAKYIGAGAVAAGGIISMCRAFPLIVGSLTGGLKSIRRGKGGAVESGGRTHRDLPIWVVALGSIFLVAVVASSNLIPTNTPGRIAGACMILIFGFMFVTVSSRITGEIGSSSNPISGMTIATLLLTCLIFVLLGWMGEQYRVAALSIAAIVCIASSNGGTTSQDLKTGYLVGATPRSQQLAIVSGAITSAVVIGGTLLALNALNRDVTDDPQYLPTMNAPIDQITQTETYKGESFKVWWVSRSAAKPGVEAGRYLVDPSTGKPRFRDDPGIGGIVKKRADGSPAEKFNPPQPDLFATIIDGILTRKLAWVLVILGASLAVVMQLCGVSALAFAVGVYLPLSTTFPLFIGGMIRGVVDRARKMSDEESDSSPAVLLSSGLIAGGSIAGILIAFLALVPKATVDKFDFSGFIPAQLVSLFGMIPSVAEFLGVKGMTAKEWTGHPWPAVVAFSVISFIVLNVGLRAKNPVVEQTADDV